MFLCQTAAFNLKRGDTRFRLGCFFVPKPNMVQQATCLDSHRGLNNSTGWQVVAKQRKPAEHQRRRKVAIESLPACVYENARNKALCWALTTMNLVETMSLKGWVTSSFVREGPKVWQLVPHITFVNFYSVLLTQQTKLILISELRMVRFLILDVTLDFVQIGITHRKSTVSGLPCKAWIYLGVTFRPFGSFRLDNFNELANL